MKLNFFKSAITLLVIVIFVGCREYKSKTSINSVDRNLKDATAQIDLLIKVGFENDRIPRSLTEERETRFTSINGFDWTEGFFPGICWNLYSVTNDKKYKNAARFFQNKIKEHRNITSNHDLGFVFNNSFGAGYKLTHNKEYEQVLIDAGNSLITRYNPNVKCIQSWNVNGEGWHATRGWKFPVIIDNLMNLELLFELTELNGDQKYREIAIAHANTTLQNHFREDFSSYHVVDYDPVTGDIRGKETAQGYAHESAWSRGQGWGLYGLTMCYRYTKDVKYLEVAEKIALFILNHPNLPKDKIPYWDFDAPKIPDEQRDASAAAIIASALLELHSYSELDFLTPAKEILESLSNKNYKAELGTNNNFVLKHCVGNGPRGTEVDVPLVYADYYYVEALLRLREIEKQNK